MLQWLRSLVFNASMYLSMAVLAVVFLPYALLSREGAYRACHSYCRWVIWTARWMVGLEVEVRGTPPSDEVLVAAKHQSFLDILVIFHAVPRAKFIMKRELLFAPILGQYAWRIGCVPVNRGKRGQAIAKMVAEVEKGRREPGQLVIYPQGTRVPPGVDMPYKVGTAILYGQLGQPCVPVATNIGVFWGKREVLRRPGTAVVEFLPRLPAGLPRDEFMQRLEFEIETVSNALMADAGFQRD
jgi:1-acyl-sn-glycerol-3-phosphate acyltransferase